jgi:hypothetical protein
MSNKRRHAQAFPLTATLIGLAVAACLTIFAIKALTVKYQVIQGGDKLKRLEKELAELTIKNEDFQTEKDRLTSPPALIKAMESGLIALQKIDDKFVVTIGREKKLAAAGEGVK